MEFTSIKNTDLHLSRIAAPRRMPGQARHATHGLSRRILLQVEKRPSQCRKVRGVQDLDAGVVRAVEWRNCFSAARP